MIMIAMPGPHPSFFPRLLVTGWMLFLAGMWVGNLHARGGMTVTTGTVLVDGRVHAAGAMLPADASVMTGGSTGAEWSMEGQATVRIGRDTSASLGKARLGLHRGSALVSSGRGFLGRRPEVGLDAGAVAVACNGSVLVAVDGGQVKVTCLEGEAVVRIRNRRGQFLRLAAGSMVMMDQAASAMPLPVEIDIGRLARTSGLLGAPFGALAAETGMRKVIARQQRLLARGKLLASSVTVTGAGGETVLGSGDSAAGQSQAGASDSAGGGGNVSGTASSSAGGAGGSAVASTGGSPGPAAACA